MSEHSARPDSWSRPPLTAVIGFSAAGFLAYWSAAFWVLWWRALVDERGAGPRPAGEGGSTDQLVVAVPLTLLVAAFAAAAIYSARHTNRYTVGRTAVLGVTCVVIAGLVAALL